MEIKVRKPNLESLTEEGIPKDFADVRDYFNSALQERSLPWIPRKTPITTEEIRAKWMPSLSTNICYVAEQDGKVVGCATVFYDISATAYEHAEKRQFGELVLTADPRHNYEEISAALDRKVIQDLQQTKRKAVTYISISSPAVQGMELAGQEPNEMVDKPEFANPELGITGEVLEYHLP